jgi:hypothetical protein
VRRAACPSPSREGESSASQRDSDHTPRSDEHDHLLGFAERDAQRAVADAETHVGSDATLKRLLESWTGGADASRFVTRALWRYLPARSLVS